MLTKQVPAGPERDIYEKRLNDLSEQVEDLQGKLAKVMPDFPRSGPNKSEPAPNSAEPFRPTQPWSI